MLNRNLDALTPRQNPGEAGAESQEFLSFAEIGIFLRRYLPLIATMTLLSALGAGIFAYTQTPLYTARTQVLIDPRISQIQREQLGEITIPLDTAQIESQIALLRSEGIARSVIATLGLIKDPEFSFPSGSWLSRLLRRDRPTAEKGEADRMRDAVEIFQDRHDVSRVGISYGINIAFTSEDPSKAARIANAISHFYVRDQLETRRQAALAGTAWLEDKITLIRQKMNAAQRQAQEYRARRDYRLPPPEPPQEGPRPTPDANGSAADQPITLEELESTAQTYRKLFESYLQAYTETLQRDTYPVSNARLISEAHTPVNKSHPKTKLIVALALLFGALLGVGLALIHNSRSGRNKA